jgi:hypothetical protein
MSILITAGIVLLAGLAAGISLILVASTSALHVAEALAED